MPFTHHCHSLFIRTLECSPKDTSALRGHNLGIAEGRDPRPLSAILRYNVQYFTIWVWKSNSNFEVLDKLF